MGDAVPPFVHEWLPQRVVFGAGVARTALAGEVERLGGRRVLLVAAAAEARLAAELSGSLPVVAAVDEVRMHVPVEVADAARQLASSSRADLLLCVGGGSTTGTAKAVALTTGLPIVAVPTTYAGSEATPVWGLTDARRKTTGVDPRVLPRTVLYDPVLTTSLPVELSVASGLNALAHCVDALWAPRANPVSSALAAEGIRSLALGLTGVRQDAADLTARTHALFGAYLAAVAFAGAGSGLHHKICHVLGGAFDLPHARLHAVVLPHVLAFNAPAAPATADRVADALQADDALTGLWDLYGALGSDENLQDLGMEHRDLEDAAHQVAEAVPAGNPRPFGLEDARQLLNRAWAGDRRPVLGHDVEGDRS